MEVKEWCHVPSMLGVLFLFLFLSLGLLSSPWGKLVRALEKERCLSLFDSLPLLFQTLPPRAVPVSPTDREIKKYENTNLPFSTLSSPFYFFSFLLF